MSEEDVGAYEANIELALVTEYKDVIRLFSHIVETERRFYLTNEVDVSVHPGTNPPLIEVHLGSGICTDRRDLYPKSES